VTALLAALAREPFGWSLVGLRAITILASAGTTLVGALVALGLAVQGLPVAGSLTVGAAFVDVGLVFTATAMLTAQIADCITQVLRPRGVGVVVDAVHECMTTRGVHKRGVSMVTSRMTGTFRSDARTRTEFLSFIGISRPHEV